MRLGLAVALLAGVAWAQPIPQRSFLPFASCAPLDGASTVYLGVSGCVDATEDHVETCFPSATRVGPITCELGGGTSGAATVTVTLRTGAAGSLSDSALACVVGAGVRTCSGSGRITVASGQCVTARVSASAPLPGLRHLTCLVEQLS